MFLFKSKILTILVNLLLTIWQAPQIIVGLIILLIFHNCEVYTNTYNNITVLNVDKGNFLGTGCFSAGPIIATTTNCPEIVKRHETGHSKQSIYLGPLFLIVIAIPSICLFWYKRINKKSQEWYLQHFPEGGNKFCAEELGGTTKIKN